MAQQSLAPSELDFVDDFYFSALFDEEQEGGGGEIFEVSDAKYAEELQFQETLMGSVIVSQMKSIGPSPMMIEGIPVVLPISDQPMRVEIIDLEAGESSLSFCEICAERKENDQMFKTESCVHSFCNDCISRHVATKVQDNIRIVTCPGLSCRAVLEMDTCRPVLTRGVIDRWENALCEEMINASQRFYCPFKDCSALLVDDNEGETIRESECPFCHRLFCAQCSVPWHPGVDCDEYQRLNEDERGREDLMVRELAKNKQWGRCPKCKFYVERTEGCPHMVCRSVCLSLSLQFKTFLLLHNFSLITTVSVTDDTLLIANFNQTL
jgi:E3 ubiquitin-protein ligase RNF144